MARTSWCALGAVVALMVPFWMGPGQTRSEAAPRIPDTIETSGLKFVTPATQQSINRGLAYLANQQNSDGSFGANSLYRHNVAVTALAGMAFLAGGNTPGRGQYGAQVEKTVGFILSASGPSGFIHATDTSSHGPMYGHGFATLFLAEVYGMTRRADIRPKLDLAVKLIVSSQNQEGGWRYDPVPEQADISVTVCQIMALRSARNSGIFVPKETIDLCTQYVQKCQNPDGGFKYQLQSGSPSMFARSAAGIVALYSAGIYEGRAIEKGLNYLSHFTPHRDSTRPGESHYFYGQYYAAQAMWQAGGHFWNRWYPAIRDELLRRQIADGSWTDPHSSEYGTAMACIVLQMPNNYLPIFQR